MAVILWSKRYQCDLCLKQAESQDADQEHAWLDEPVPDGWTSLRAATLRVDLKDFYGSQMSHLCDECSVLTIHEIARRMTAKAAASLGKGS